MKKKQKIIIAVLTVEAALLLWAIWANFALKVTTYTVSCDGLPETFCGYRIAQVSDLHNSELMCGKTLSALRESAPDIIAITGDLVDSRRTDINVALDFAKGAVKIAPCYFVSGNHEARIAQYSELCTALRDIGVTVLCNEALTVERAGEHIRLIGLQDPSFETDYLFGDADSVAQNILSELCTDNGDFTLVLSHRPELFEVYSESGADLVLSGHAHGGQFVLPFVGGLVAPGQGLFPKYDSGVYTEGKTNMIVSRGIGNSIIPLRINNPPELIIIELAK